MPIHRQKKDTTPNTSGSTPEQTAPALPEQRAFHQHLRELARGGIRVVLEGVMREELDAALWSRLGREQPEAQRLSQRVLHPRPNHYVWSDLGLAGSARSGGPVSYPGVRALPSL